MIRRASEIALTFAALALFAAACRDRPQSRPAPDETRAATPGDGPSVDAFVAPALLKLREEYLADAVAFSGLSRDEVLKQIFGAPMKDEWNAWEKAGPMTDARIKEFYKQTKSYIYDLAGWHLYDPLKWESDMELVNVLRQHGVKNVLDFGGGVGFNAFPLAEAGFDVTLADLDSVTLSFGAFRAKQHGIKLKIWKSDVEPMPPDAKYDVILCLDVLEHLPAEELRTTVDKLVKLKHANTRVLIHAPFGRTSVHPMHLDATQATLDQVNRLRSALPAP